MGRPKKNPTPPSATPAPTPTEPPQDNAAFEAQRETLTGDVRDAILKHLKENKTAITWDMATEQEQERVIASAMHFAEQLVRGVVDLVAADGRKVIPASLIQFKVKGGELAMQLNSPAMIETMAALASMRGSTMHIVVADDVPYQGHRKPVKVNRQQGDMLPEKPDGEDLLPPTGSPKPTGPDTPPPAPPSESKGPVPAPEPPPEPPMAQPPASPPAPPPGSEDPPPATTAAPGSQPSADELLATARLEGAQARMDGLPRSACPHPLGYMIHKAWVEGWVAEDTKASPSALDDIDTPPASDFLPTSRGPDVGTDAPTPVEPPPRRRPAAEPPPPAS